MKKKKTLYGDGHNGPSPSSSLSGIHTRPPPFTLSRPGLVLSCPASLLSCYRIGRQQGMLVTPYGVMDMLFDVMGGGRGAGDGGRQGTWMW